MSTITSIFDHYFEPLAPMITREMAEAIVNREPDPKLVARVMELADKSDEGTLTEDEREEYVNLVDAGDLIALLKAKARLFLEDYRG
jgi:hypothetical protein